MSHHHSILEMVFKIDKCSLYCVEILFSIVLIIMHILNLFFQIYCCPALLIHFFFCFALTPSFTKYTVWPLYLSCLDGWVQIIESPGRRLEERERETYLFAPILPIIWQWWCSSTDNSSCGVIFFWPPQGFQVFLYIIFVPLGFVIVITPLSVVGNSLIFVNCLHLYITLYAVPSLSSLPVKHFWPATLYRDLVWNKFHSI